MNMGSGEPQQDNPGSMLKTARLDKRKSLSKLSRDLNIAKETLQAIEEWDIEHLPKKPFLAGIISRYAQILDVQMDGRFFLPSQKDIPKIRLRYGGKKPIILSEYFKFIALFVLVLAVVLYLSITGLELFAKPDLTIYEPAKYDFVSGDELTVKGMARKESVVTVNGSPVLIDDNGNFNSKIYIRKGLNEIEVVAANSIGRRSLIKLDVYRD